MIASPPLPDRLDLPVLKGRFPFRLATTSYIVPAAVLPNVRLLAPHVDEIELLFYETGAAEDDLPSPDEIAELARIGAAQDLAYNVHLPLDVHLADPDPDVRAAGAAALRRIAAVARPLEPTAYLLHLERRTSTGELLTDPAIWRERTQPWVEALLADGLASERLVVENLDTDLDWHAPLVADLDLRLCLDVGHCLRYGHDLGGQLARHHERIAMIHLHGVDGDTDHVGLDRLADEPWQVVRGWLVSYTAGLSLELFTLRHLQASVPRLLELAGRPAGD